jgi:hypothetical protein
MSPCFLLSPYSILPTTHEEEKENKIWFFKFSRLRKILATTDWTFTHFSELKIWIFKKNWSILSFVKVIIVLVYHCSKSSLKKKQRRNRQMFTNGIIFLQVEFNITSSQVFATLVAAPSKILPSTK